MGTPLLCLSPAAAQSPGPLNRLLHLPRDGVLVRNHGERHRDRCASEGSESRRCHQCTPDPVPWGGGRSAHRGPLSCRLACREGCPTGSLGGLGAPATLGPGLQSLQCCLLSRQTFSLKGASQGEGDGAAEWTPEALGGQGGSLSPQPDNFSRGLQAGALVLPNPGQGTYWVTGWPVSTFLRKLRCFLRTHPRLDSLDPHLPPQLTSVTLDSLQRKLFL